MSERSFQKCIVSRKQKSNSKLEQLKTRYILRSLGEHIRLDFLFIKLIIILRSNNASKALEVLPELLSKIFCLFKNSPNTKDLELLNWIFIHPI